jgi:hypothetical protein
VILGPGWEEAADEATPAYDRGQHVSISQLGSAARIYALVATEVCSKRRVEAVEAFQLA